MASVSPAVDYSSEAIRRRILLVSRHRDHLYDKQKPVDMSSGAIARRLVTASRLRDLCLRLGRSNPRMEG